MYEEPLSEKGRERLFNLLHLCWAGGEGQGLSQPVLFKNHLLRWKYYSDIKRNTSESVLIRWMNLEPIIQSEFSSVQSLSRVKWSLSRVDSLRPHGLQHTRLPCPSPTPGACWNSCPLSWWCHPTISSSIVPFSSCLQSCPASGSFQMSQFFILGGQSIEVSASALSFQYYSGLISFRMNWLDLPAVHGTFKSLLQHHSSKASILQCPAFFMSSSHIHTWPLEKP